MDEGYEQDVEKCKNMSDRRATAEKNEEFRRKTLDTVAPVKILPFTLFNRLQLKGKNFKSSGAAT